MTDKAKALFFAQYLGQEVYVSPRLSDTELVDIFSPMSCASDGGYLLLRSIEQLTDEEYKELAIHLQWEENLISYGKRIVGLFTEDNDLKLNPPDFLITVSELLKAEKWLRDHGFILPSDKHAVNAGWVKLNK